MTLISKSIPNVSVSKYPNPKTIKPYMALTTENQSKYFSLGYF